jgi:hypothetical protein
LVKAKERRKVERASAARAQVDELTLRIAECAKRLAQERQLPPGGELALWLEAEAEVKRELRR